METWPAAGGDDDFNFPADPADLQANEAALLQHSEHGSTASENAVPFHLLVKLPTNQLPRTVLPRAPTFALGNAANGLLSARTSLRNTLFSSAPAKATVSGEPAGAESSAPAKSEGAAAAAAAAPSARFVGGTTTQGWTVSQTNQFFTALSQFGTDFSSIAVLFPGKTRREVLHKYKQELRHSSDKVMQALATQKPIDVERFLQCKRQTEAANEEPARKLNEDELVFLRGLEDIAPAAQNKIEGLPEDDFTFENDEDVPLFDLYSPAAVKEALPLFELYAPANGGGDKKPKQEKAKLAPKKTAPKKTTQRNDGDAEVAPTVKKLRTEQGEGISNNRLEVDFDFD